MMELRSNGESWNTVAWEALVIQQASALRLVDLNPRSFDDDIDPGEVLAFYDRSGFDDPWRRIFVVAGADDVTIFTEDGVLIDEAENNTPLGIHSLYPEFQENTFLAEWEAGYYMLAKPVPEAVDEGEGEEVLDGGTDVHGLHSIIVPGGRIKMSFGLPAMWYGGCVMSVGSDDTEPCIIAFDDGEARAYNQEELKREFDTGVLTAMDVDDTGLVAGQTGHPKVSGLTFYTGGRSTGVGKLMGVLIGETNEMLAGMPIHVAHKVRNDIDVEQPANRKSDTGRRSTRAQSKTPETSSTSLREREGWYTFRRGDYVSYTTKGLASDNSAALRTGESAEAVVYGINYHASKKQVGGDQGRKLLVLYHEDSKTFFAGPWSRWRRVPKGVGTSRCRSPGRT